MRAYSGSAPPSQARKVIIGGLEHHVLEWQSAESDDRAPRPTVLLLHGFMDVAASWESIAPALCAIGFRVLAPDMRGFGDGPRVGPGSSYIFADYIVDVAGLVDQLVGQEVCVVGHSMGGVVATLFAGTFPDRVKKLVNLEGLGPPDSSFEEAPQRMRDYVGGMRTYASPARETQPRGAVVDLDDAVARLKVNHPHVPEAILRARAPGLLRTLDDGRLAWRFDPLHRVRSPIPFYASAFRAFASAVACPVLSVGGGPHGYHPSDESERLAAFRDLRVAELPGAGHMMHWTQPEALSRLLVEFLRS